FAAHNERDAVIAREVHDRATETRDLAARQDELDPEHVIGHRAIAEGMRAASIGAGVPADGGYFLARGVGSEEKAVRSRGDAHSEIGHARLNDRNARRPVDRDDAAETRGRDDDGVRACDRPARKTGSRAPRHDWRAGGASRLHDRRDLLRRTRHSDRGRRAPIEPGVVFPHEEILGPPEHVLRTTYLLELADEGGGHPTRGPGTGSEPCA